jgi:hypothetical protein
MAAAWKEIYYLDSICEHVRASPVLYTELKSPLICHC